MYTVEVTFKQYLYDKFFSGKTFDLTCSVTYVGSIYDRLEDQQISRWTFLIECRFRIDKEKIVRKEKNAEITCTGNYIKMYWKV